MQETPRSALTFSSAFWLTGSTKMIVLPGRGKCDAMRVAIGRSAGGTGKIVGFCCTYVAVPGLNGMRVAFG